MQQPVRSACFQVLTKDPGVDKMDQAEILQQVILDGCSRYQHSPLGCHRVESLVGLVVRVLQPVALNKAPPR